VTLSPTITVSEPIATSTPYVCGLDDIHEASRSVVRLETETGSGTGFLIDADTVVTARHVVADAAEWVLIQFADGTVDAGRPLQSPNLDLAVLRLSKPRPELGP
jgi:S1-C subfamily serine protease